MENKTVKELREIAKERKIKYYYKLRREDLMRVLQPVVQRPASAPRPVPALRPIPAPHPVVQRPVPASRLVRSILDEPFPSSASSSVLTPDPRKPIGLFSTLAAAARSVTSYVSNTFNNLLEEIDPYIPEPIKKKVRNARDGVEKRIKSLKDIVFGKPPIVFKLTKHAVKNVAKQFSYEVEGEEQDTSSFLNRARDEVLKIMRENKNKKVNFVLTCDMSRLSNVTGEETTRTLPFACKYIIVLEATDLGELYDTSKGEILENISKYSSNGSNWKVSKILKMDINMINYSPLSASSWIELDKFLASKKAIINMQNGDNECFKWCVTRALNMKNNHPERIDKELIEKSKEVNWKGIEFPVKLNQIEKFENSNPDISVSVFGFENKKPYPLKKLKYFG